MRPIFYVLCAFLALMTVLSIVPVFLFFWVCDFSGQCLSHSFAQVMALRGTVRTLAVATLLGPLFLLPTYTLAFLHCHNKSRDVLDRHGRAPHPSVADGT